MYDDPSPVSPDKDNYEAWTKDELIWSDVYSKKPAEYLEAIARGEVPRWDTVTGKYIYGEEASNLAIGGSNSGYADPQADMDPDEDLPF
jgi:hypothetical protein